MPLILADIYRVYSEERYEIKSLNKELMRNKFFCFCFSCAVHVYFERWFAVDVHVALISFWLFFSCCSFPRYTIGKRSQMIYKLKLIFTMHSLALQLKSTRQPKRVNNRSRRVEINFYYYRFFIDCWLIVIRFFRGIFLGNYCFQNKRQAAVDDAAGKREKLNKKTNIFAFG